MTIKDSIIDTSKSNKKPSIMLPAKKNRIHEASYSDLDISSPSMSESSVSSQEYKSKGSSSQGGNHLKLGSSKRTGSQRSG